MSERLKQLALLTRRNGKPYAVAKAFWDEYDRVYGTSLAAVFAVPDPARNTTDSTGTPQDSTEDT